MFVSSRRKITISSEDDETLPCWKTFFSDLACQLSSLVWSDLCLVGPPLYNLLSAQLRKSTTADFRASLFPCLFPVQVFDMDKRIFLLQAMVNHIEEVGIHHGTVVQG